LDTFVDEIMRNDTKIVVLLTTPSHNVLTLQKFVDKGAGRGNYMFIIDHWLRTL
jgi:hypothetical protein